MSAEKTPQLDLMMGMQLITFKKLRNPSAKNFRTVIPFWFISKKSQKLSFGATKWSGQQTFQQWAIEHATASLQTWSALCRSCPVTRGISRNCGDCNHGMLGEDAAAASKHHKVSYAAEPVHLPRVGRPVDVCSESNKNCTSLSMLNICWRSFTLQRWHTLKLLKAEWATSHSTFNVPVRAPRHRSEIASSKHLASTVLLLSLVTIISLS